MREILFRGNANGKWVEGQLVYETTTTPPTPIIVCGEAEWVDGNEWKIPDWYSVDPETVGQYTGLTDKNGKRIYEGDIVSVNDDYNTYGQMAGEIREVYFVAGCHRLKPKYDSNIARGDRGYLVEDGDDFEVIGNIHDNFDLLK